MKYVLLTILFVLFTNLGLQETFAETSIDISNNGEGASSEVHIENSVGESITCVNGQCSTLRQAQGNNTTTVCINGKCETSQDGNIERNEGGTRIKVETPLRSSSFEGQAITPLPTTQPEASDSSESSISAQKDDDQSSEQQFSLKQMMDALRNFFSELFS